MHPPLADRMKKCEMWFESGKRKSEEEEEEDPPPHREPSSCLSRMHDQQVRGQGTPYTSTTQESSSSPLPSPHHTSTALPQ
ncbi:hypothetical protein BV898_18755 [Hypsibius exemplaris]|uniref:Uncharacterized protein n=1 Tax=Hypsibius exemplaris TaxID=2072580 RepID=A0A9X6NIC0_HYPEX|nr:hypothetical protein BV898_18755 [Hypsibius exemplaris]